MAKVSVIVTNHNYARYLPECLSSIRAQTFQDYELIVVDDASDDNSVRLAQRYVPDKLLCLGANLGTVKASNLGVDVACGEYCTFINADDFVDPTFLADCVQALDTGAQNVAFAYTDFWHLGESLGKQFNNGIIFPEWDLELLKKYNYILASALFKRTVFKSLGGFQFDLGMEDYDLWLRMGLSGYVGKRVPGYLYKYRAHDANRTLTMDMGSIAAKIKARNGLVHKDDAPMFSLCYAAGRAGKIKGVVQEWASKADTKVEIIVAVDGIDAASIEEANEAISDYPWHGKVVIQHGIPGTAIKAWNLGAIHSRGKVIIAISDDFVPPKAWDTQLINALDKNPGWVDKPMVILVDDGNDSVDKENVTLPIMTRPWYTREGFVLCPEYMSIYADTELYHQAAFLGELVDIRRQVPVFEHVHYTNSKREMDEVDKIHSSRHRWEVGQAIFKQRMALKFSTIPDKHNDYVARVKDKTMAVSLELSLWLDAWMKKTDAKNALSLGLNFDSYVMGLSCTVICCACGIKSPEDQAHQEWMMDNANVVTMEIGDILGPFDVIFVNCGEADSDLRSSLTQMWVPGRLAPSGSVILHDGHFVEVQKTRTAMEQAGWKVETIDQTTDAYGRFALLMTRS